MLSRSALLLLMVAAHLVPTVLSGAATEQARLQLSGARSRAHAAAVFGEIALADVNDPPRLLYRFELGWWGRCITAAWSPSYA